MPGTARSESAVWDLRPWRRRSASTIVIAVTRQERVERGLVAAPMAALGVALLVGGCGSSASSPGTAPAPTSSTTAAQAALHILVTNDDGVGAPGIDAVVQALRALPATEVTVVAPATNESGTGSRTTPGALQVARATTASGYAATSVNGYPVDTIIWAVDDHGIPTRPDLVVSGVNNGANLGPLAGVSGTVGAARAAFGRGIPALAASQGVDDGLSPDYSAGAAQVVTWVQSHRAALVGHTYGSAALSGNLNVPTCPGGRIRGPVSAPLATSFGGLNIATVDCSSTATSYSDDAHAFVLGYAVIAPL